MHPKVRVTIYNYMCHLHAVGRMHVLACNNLNWNNKFDAQKFHNNVHLSIMVSALK